MYEDADYEDVTHSELRRIMWSNSTPSAKREACLKHAKLLGESCFVVFYLDHSLVFSQRRKYIARVARTLNETNFLWVIVCRHDHTGAARCIAC